MSCRQEALELIACGFGVTETAERLEIEPGRVRRWMAQPSWGRDFEHVRQKVDHLTSTRLATLGTRALAALIEIADDPTTPVRTRASIWSDLLNRSGLAASSQLTDVADMDRDQIVDLLRSMPADYLREALG
jgi:hypothetical protein